MIHIWAFKMTNTPPVANSFEETGVEDTSVVITPSFFDIDTSDTHSFTVDTTGTVGSVTINNDGTISYDPNGQFDYLAAYAGDLEDDTTTAYDSFTYTVTDSSGASSTATVTVRLLGQNDGPVAVATSQTTGEDSSVTITPDFSDADASDTHSLSVDTTETLGTVTVNDDGTFSYDPAGQFEYLAVGETTTDSFTYTVTDAAGESSTETVTVTITGQNDAPVAVAVEAEVNEGGTIIINNGVSDVDTSDTHLIGVNNAETQGSVLVNSDGTFTYDANGQFDHLGAGETATDSFVYMALDGSWSGASATVTVTITGENDAPVAAEVSGETDEDSSITIAPSYSDADSSDTHSFSVDTTNTTGSVTVNGDGTFSYDPSGQFDGLTAGETATDTFTYTVTDSSGASSTETVTIEITGVNDAPVVSGLSAQTSEDTSVLIDPVFTDAEASDTHTITFDASETSGAVVLVDGSFHYDPTGQFEGLAAGENATDTFTYTVTDSSGASSTNTVTVTINGANDAPVASAVTASTDEDSSVTITPDYSDTDGSDTHSFSVDTTSTAGLVTVNDDGTFSFDPSGAFEDLAVGESTTDTFSYTVKDGSGASSTNTVTVTINGVNDAPAAAAVTASTDEDSSVTITPDYSDADTSDTHSFSVDTSDTAGSVTVNEDGRFSYDPSGAFDGLTAGETTTDTFTYTVTDASGTSSTETVTIEITGVNDAPVVSGLSAQTSEDTSVLIDPVFTDAEASDTHTISFDASETSGAVTLVDGSFRYDPNGAFEDLAVGESTTDTFSYTVTDSSGASSTNTVTVTINGANDAPVAAAVTASTDEDSAVTVTPDYSDTDGSDMHSLTVDTTSTAGSLTVNEDGTLSYDPTNLVGSLGLGETFTDTFTYTVTDGAGESSTATATVTVAGDSEILSGTTGDDTYSIWANSGSSMIDYSTEIADGGFDTIVFEDLSLSDLIITTVEHDDGNGTALKISWEADGDRLAGQLQIANMGENIECYEFADGTVLSNISVRDDGRLELYGVEGADNVVYGTTNADLIFGSDGSDILDAGTASSGSQHLRGYDGNDTYLFGLGGRNTLIHESADHGSDTVIFKDLSLQGVTFTTYEYGDESPYGTVLEFNWIGNEGGDQLRISGLSQTIERFEFADGTTLSSIELLDDGRVQLTGTDGDDIISGTSGDDVLLGADGSDTFVFDSSSFGNDVIADFTAGEGSEDVISFDADVFADYDAVVAAATDDGSNTVIVLDEDNSVTLTGVLVSELHSDDFEFV
ncbi:Endo-1,3-1,4-beta-glycanase ExsH [Pseudovibrio axinellae]|uniref:Endo-1,3-1,4-beta-glycanase ExsH n=2 Tax=Pseudovibrio axinellae TaxID=989403 RepID=A0A165WQM6_9HYPH|nr:Endo-1,3-1,4-beta-glycanase ExsH [Pseudovibrio axinellae]SER69971.1 VCBS repeat-containing protein [Pseudovibrio axinellae]